MYTYVIMDISHWGGIFSLYISHWGGIFGLYYWTYHIKYETIPLRKL